MTIPNPDAVRAFHQLHHGPLLLLANVWDAGTARLVESRGARALATTSAGVAWAHGYPDGDRLPVPLLVATVRDIARVVRVPLSVDVEGGYSDDPATVGEAVRGVLDAGGVGINLEDGGGDPERLCAKIEHALRAGERAGVPVFVNARADMFLRPVVAEERRVEEVLARAARYRAAGAHGLFVPGVTATADIAALVAGAGLPLNVLARPALPPRAELERLGVRRLSAGSGVTMSAYRRIAALAEAFLRDGDSAALLADVTPYAEIDALMPE